MRAAGAGLGLVGVGTLPATAQSSAVLGRLTLPRAKEAVVSDDGTTAFVAVTDGFAVVDISDPTAPELRYEDREIAPDSEKEPMTGVYDVKLDGGLLAVTGPANPAGSRPFQGVVVYDVSDPANPEQVSVHATDFFNHNCDIWEGTVFLCGNDGRENALVTVDAETGVELGRWFVTSEEPGWAELPFGLWPLHDVSVTNGIAALAQWDAGTWLVDVSDPANPAPVGKIRGRTPEAFEGLSDEEIREETLQTPGNDHFAAMNDEGTLLAVGAESWDVEPEEEDVKPGGIAIYDVTDPTRPEELSVIEAPPSDDESLSGVWTTSHNFEFANGKLYTSWYRGGVRVFDVTDPAAPAELLAWRDSETTSFWTAQAAVNGEFFVGSSRRDPSAETPAQGAALYAVTDPRLPTPTPSPTPTRTDSPTATGQPGFSLVGALAALGLGGLLRRRKQK